MKKNITIKVGEVKRRDPLAVAAKLRSGAGAHTPKKYSRRKKHKNRVDFSE